MAKGKKDNQKESQSIVERVRTDDKLLGIASLFILIIIFAIGVGAFLLVRNLTEDDNDVSSNEDSEQVEDSENESERNEDSQDENNEENMSSEEGESSDENVDENETEQNQEDSNQENDESRNDEENDGNVEGESVSVTEALTNVWVANNYSFGDIDESPYEIKYGDTLWEISEGYFGDGFRWIEIAQANQDKIGTAPNGEVSLIIAGESLELPGNE